MKPDILFAFRRKTVALSVVMLFLLTACEELPTREDAEAGLYSAPVCCKLLSEIQYAPFPSDTSKVITIDESSPARYFETGKSHFVAFELPDQEPPYRIELASYPIGFALTNATILKPEMAILDEDYGLLQTAGPVFTYNRLGFFEAMQHLDLSFSTVLKNNFYDGAVVVDDPRARYLLIYTTSANMAGGVPHEYMDFAQIYAGSGLWVPLPMGKRQAIIGHSAYGAINLSLGSVTAVDVSEFEDAMPPATEEYYQGNGFRVRPPLQHDYRYKDISGEQRGRSWSHIVFTRAVTSGANGTAFVRSIKTDPKFDSWTGDVLSHAIDSALRLHGIDFDSFTYTHSELEINGAQCQRLDFEANARNPFLKIMLPIKGYDIYCVHPEFADALYPLLVRIGANYGYAYDEPVGELPEEVKNFYNGVQFDTP